MNDTNLNEESAWSDSPGGPIVRGDGLAKKVVLAGIGCAATVYDSASHTFDRFAERGQRVADDVQQSVDQARRENSVSRTRFGDFLRTSMDSFLNTVNFPSKTDLDTINVKLNIVNRKLDDLEIELSRGTASPPPPAPPAPGPRADESGT